MTPVLPTLACTFMLFILVFGVILTRSAVARRKRQTVRQRLEDLIGSTSSNILPLKLNFRDEVSTLKAKGGKFSKHLERMHDQASIGMTLPELLNLIISAALILASLPLAFDLPALPCIISAFCALFIPYFIMRQKAETARNKFLLQLPNAIDLMVSILRSGHSLPQSVKSVADESPAPCGSEFTEIFQRMNLGQSFPEALEYSVHRYDSFELDLIRRATAIHMEVGGSLAEILDKTNETLKQRIQLKNQISVMTAQGRLSALICGLLPLVIAFAFSQINPHYMKPLLENSTGQLLLSTALGLELVGFLIMRKLSSFRI